MPGGAVIYYSSGLLLAHGADAKTVAAVAHVHHYIVKVFVILMIIVQGVRGVAAVLEEHPRQAHTGVVIAE
jgi:hypothetical protein